MPPKSRQTETEEAEVNVVFLITHRFKTVDEFSIFIERYAAENNLSLMETLLEYCSVNDIEPDSVAKILSESLVEKIRAEASNLHLLKDATPALPFDDTP